MIITTTGHVQPTAQPVLSQDTYSSFQAALFKSGFKVLTNQISEMKRICTCLTTSESDWPHFDTHFLKWCCKDLENSCSDNNACLMYHGCDIKFLKHDYGFTTHSLSLSTPGNTKKSISVQTTCVVQKVM